MKKKISIFLSSIIIASSIIGLCGINATATGADAYWIEGESGSPTVGVGFGTISGAEGSTYDTLSANKALRIVSGTDAEIGVDYEFEINTAQSYDIFVHGTYEVDSAWMSQVSMHMDGAQCDVTNLKNEGWIIKGSGNPNFQVGWQKVTETLSSGSHSFRWQIDGIGTKAATNKALIDAIIVLPSKAEFTPTYMTLDSNAYAVFPMQNKADFELCQLLMDNDLSNVEEDISLPTETSGGYAVTWSSSDESAITSEGAVTVGTSPKDVVLTAAVTIDGVEYTKDFNITVGASAAVPAFKAQWIEGEAFTGKNSSALAAVGDRTDSAMSENSTIRLNTTNAPDAEGYALTYDFAVPEDGGYNIWIRSASNNEYASPFTMSVDGTLLEKALITDEGWLHPMSSGSTTYPTGWSKAEAYLTAGGKHTLKWAVTESGKQKYFALVDAVVIVPEDADFAPTATNIPATRADYELCTLLSGYDLSNVSEDIELANVTPTGYTVTWSSSNEYAITADGRVNVGNTVKKAVLTAAVTIDGTEYTKSFNVTVASDGSGALAYSWIEAEDAEKASSTKLNVVGGNDALYGSSCYRLNTKNAPNDDDGYYLEWPLEISYEGTYDIWIRSDETSTSMSPFTLSIDGAEQEKVYIAAEGWIKPTGSGNTSYGIGWSRVTLNLLAGKHTIRWTVKEQNKSGDYFALVDAIAVIQSNIGFEPTAMDVDATSISFDLSTLLAGAHLDALTSDLVLADVTPMGRPVTWTTSNADVVATNGAVTRSTEASLSATLTASTEISGVKFTKDFNIIVPKQKAYSISEFMLTTASGDAITALSEGMTVRASAKVEYIPDGSKNATLILAQYRSDNSMVGFNYETVTVSSDSLQTVTADYTVEDLKNGDYIKAYLWTDLGTMIPLTETITK